MSDRRATRSVEPPEAVIDQVARGRESCLERLQRYIRQPSISAYGEGVDEMADMVAADLRELGGDAEVVPGVDFPVVYGRFDVGAERTVLIHGMYDTVPADDSEWSSPPFEARIIDFAGLGDCVVGRGAEDTKGPLASVLSMVSAHHTGNTPLPVNLILLFEASELGSKSLPAFVEARKQELSDADVAYWPWHTQRADGTAVAWLGAKGLMTMKARVRGGEWGGPAGSEVHGLHSIWISNPIHRLVAALASMKSSDDQMIVVDGFYDQVSKPDSVEEELIDRLKERVEPKDILRELNVARFKQKDLSNALRAYCQGTEINISGIAGGTVIEDGHKVELPSEAVASIDLRLLDGMTVDHVIRSLRDHLDAKGFNEVELELLNGYQGASMPMSNWAVQALLDTYRRLGYDPEIWPRTSTAIGSHNFVGTLGIPWIATTLGHSGNKHAPDEYLTVDGYLGAIDFIVHLMWTLSAFPRA